VDREGGWADSGVKQVFCTFYREKTLSLQPFLKSESFTKKIITWEKVIKEAYAAKSAAALMAMLAPRKAKKLLLLRNQRKLVFPIKKRPTLFSEVLAVFVFRLTLF
jgi:hypothetical protein